MSDAARRKAKQKSAVEKPKLDNARKSRGIYFIDLDAEEFKRIMTNARRKFKFRCQRQCLVDFNFISTVAQLDNTRRNMLVLSKLTNL